MLVYPPDRGFLVVGSSFCVRIFCDGNDWTAPAAPYLSKADEMHLAIAPYRKLRHATKLPAIDYLAAFLFLCNHIPLPGFILPECHTDTVNPLH